MTPGDFFWGGQHFGSDNDYAPATSVILTNWATAGIRLDTAFFKTCPGNGALVNTAAIGISRFENDFNFEVAQPVV